MCSPSQSKLATYDEIRARVKKNYGLRVSNLALLWTKNLCGLANTQHKEHCGPQGRCASNLTPEKEAAIRAAFIRFGLIKDE